MNTKPPITPEVMAPNGSSYVVQHTPTEVALERAVAQMEAASAAANAAATRTLAYLGYTYEGGEQWKPPLAEALLPPPVSDYQRGHMAGYQWAIQSIGELLTMWSKPHPARVGIDAILTESQR